MTDRDYLWCALNLALDQEEELDGAIHRFLETAGPCMLICQVHPDVSTTD